VRRGSVGFRQRLLLLVAAGAAYRVFTKDVPDAPNRAVMLYYLLVLAALRLLNGIGAGASGPFMKFRPARSAGVMGGERRHD
jgi:hypothetical protein